MAPGLLGDLRLAARSSRAAPAVTTAALLTLTLGIGSTLAIFAIADALALRPLPVSRPEGLVTITSATALRYGFHGGAGWNHGMWERFRARADAFDGAFAWTLQRLDLSEGGEMQPANGLIASGDVFAVLGVPALIGRTFTAADDVRAGGAAGAVAVISHRLWQRRFAGRSEVLGSRLLVDRVPLTIVGVAPAWFGGVDVGQPFDVAIPFGSEALVHGGRAVMNSERSLLLTVMLRLKRDQDAAAATAVLRTMQPEIVGPGAPAFLEEPFILDDASRGISDRSRLRQRYQYPLVVLSIVSVIVLVIVCLNVANLLLSRAAARRSEVAVRFALGAPRWRIARQHLIEALALGIAGTAGGLLFAIWSSRALVTRLPFPEGAASLDLSIDWRIAALTAAVTAFVVVLFGTFPAVHAARVAPFEALRTGRGSAGSAYASSALVVVQVALSIVLLAAAGLFVGTSNRLAGVPLGFDPKDMLIVSVSAPGQNRQQMLDAVAAVPGVTRAAGSIWTPVDVGGGQLIDASGRRADVSQRVAYNFVTPGWFATYRTAFRAGRDFDARDAPNAPRVAIVNDALRRSLLAGADALGATIHAGPCGHDGCTVVGVVADAVYGQSLRDAAPPTIYIPIDQSEGLAMPGAPFRISVRAAGDPAGVAIGLRARLHDLDSRLAFASRRLEQDLAASVAQERLLAMLSGFFGAVALLLAGVGLYGVTSYAVTRRRAEIGIRLALGGQPSAVVGAIVGRLVVFVVAGAVSGLLCALWLARFVAPLLYGLAPHDPWTLVLAASSLAVVGAAAGWIPAARAARIDPARTLRQA